MSNEAEMWDKRGQGMTYAFYKASLKDELD